MRMTSISTANPEEVELDEPNYS